MNPSHLEMTLKRFHSVILIAPISSAGRVLAEQNKGSLLGSFAAHLLPDNLGLNNVSRTFETFRATIIYGNCLCACQRVIPCWPSAFVLVPRFSCAVTAADHVTSLRHRSKKSVTYKLLFSSSMALPTGFFLLLCGVTCDAFWGFVLRKPFFLICCFNYGRSDN